MGLIYVVGVIAYLIFMLIGPQRVVATIAGYKQGDIVRDPVPVVYGTVHTGEFIVPTTGTTHTPGNCESCGSQEFRTYRGVGICSYCRSVA